MVILYEQNMAAPQTDDIGYFSIKQKQNSQETGYLWKRMLVRMLGKKNYCKNMYFSNLIN